MFAAKVIFSHVLRGWFVYILQSWIQLSVNLFVLGIEFQYEFPQQSFTQLSDNELAFTGFRPLYD